MTIYLVSTKWYNMTPEQREKELWKAADERKAEDAADQWTEKSSGPACDWPEWVSALVMKTDKRFIWDSLGREYKIGYHSREEAEAARIKFVSALEGYVADPAHDQEKAWYVANHFNVNVRALTDEALEMDLEIADSLELAKKKDYLGWLLLAGAVVVMAAATAAAIWLW